jgi:hypothetical protein
MKNTQPFTLCSITVRSSCGTYVARLCGLAASCTMGSAEAAAAVLRKHDPQGEYEPSLVETGMSMTVYSVVRKGSQLGRRES